MGLHQINLNCRGNFEESVSLEVHPVYINLCYYFFNTHTHTHTIDTVNLNVLFSLLNAHILGVRLSF